MSDTKQIDDGGPAFPHSHDWGWSEKTKRYEASGQPGMTLRDWFAGQALAEQTKFAVSSSEQYDAAKRCYALADAMIVARKEKQ